MTQEIVIPGRFSGPAKSANGGYAAGTLAQYVEGPAEVRLLAPPPLDRSLHVERQDEVISVFDGDQRVMEARSADLDFTLPPPVPLHVAAEAIPGFPGFDFHGAPACFVCGPERESPDGLRIFPGPVVGADLVAAPWTPTSDLAGEDGSVSDLVVWSALDCPGAWAGRAVDPEGMPYFPALGSMTAVLDEPVQVGERHVVMAWHLGTEGRKLHTQAVLYSEGGAVKGRASHIEIKVPADWTEK